MSGGILAVGSGITMYRLLAARMVMRMAVKGIRMRNTTSWAKQLRKEFGLTPRASYATILAAVDEAIAKLEPVVRAEGTITEV